MTHGGETLDKWKAKLPSNKQQMTFIVEMLHQIILALKKIHSLGYSHSDLKLENICARQRQDGSYAFTLIDLGMSAQLNRLGENNQ